MKSVNANDIYAFGKMKADIAFIIWQLQTDRTYSKESAVEELTKVMGEAIEFESHLSDVFLERNI